MTARVNRTVRKSPMGSGHESREILVLPERCLGCGLCEWACRQVLAVGDRDGGPPGAVRPGIDLRFFGPTPSPLICRHCEQAPCLEACIAGALRCDPVSGLISHDPDRCVSCWMCVMTCPSGAVSPAAEGGVLKCSGCPGREGPACVASCPTQALIYADPAELESLRQRSSYSRVRPQPQRGHKRPTGTDHPGPGLYARRVLTGTAALSGWARASGIAMADRAGEEESRPTPNQYDSLGPVAPWLPAILGRETADRLDHAGFVPPSILRGMYELHTGLRDRAGSDELIRLTIRASLGALVFAGLIAIFATPPALESFLRSSSGSSGSNRRGRLLFTMEGEKWKRSSTALSESGDRAPEVLVMPASPPGRICEAPAFIAGVMAWNVMRGVPERSVELRLPHPSDTLLEAVACALSAAGHTVLAASG